MLTSTFYCILLTPPQQIGVSFHPPSGLGFQQLYVDSETKFSKEPLHSYIYTSVPQGMYTPANRFSSPQDLKLTYMPS